jgi:hypothetical protein
LVDPRIAGSLLSYRQMEKRHFGAAAIDCSLGRYTWVESCSYCLNSPKDIINHHHGI